MIDFGIVKPGTTLYIPFSTYDSNDPSASVTTTGLATTDIEIYKDGSNTTRASDSGYALLGTDGIDEFGTGIHGISVNLADNAVAGYYAAGSQYFIVLASITVDAGVVNAILATFRIGLPDAVLNTTIATLSTQTSFALTAGPAEADALNGCVVYIHDVASAVQGGFAVVSDYDAINKTVTLVAATTFTIAATDNVAIFPPALQPTVWGRTVDVSAGGEAGVDWANVGSPTTSLALTGTTIATTQKVDLETIKTQTVTAAAAVTVLASVGTAATSTAQTGDNFARLGAPAGASVSADIAAMKADTAAILLDTGTDGVVVAAGSKTGYVLSATGSAALTEGYAADGATMTLNQAVYMIWSLLAEKAIASTTLTAKKLDGTTTAMTFTLDDATTPTSITRAT